MATEPIQPINYSLNILGKKWTLHILNSMFIGNKRYNEIHKSIPSISDKILSQRLKELQKKLIIEKKVVLELDKTKHEYILTDLGKSLNGFFFELAIYSSIHYTKKIFQNPNLEMSRIFPLIGKMYMMSKEGTHQSIILHNYPLVNSGQKLRITMNPVWNTLQVLDSTSMFTIVHLIADGKIENQEILECLEKANPRIINEEISHLLNEKIISIEKNNTNSNEYRYLLTNKGKDIEFAVLQLHRFGSQIILLDNE